jgi:RimJ/RimL family protein N-acetyltransferase
MLTGEKIILRPIMMEDWEETVKWRNDLFIKSSTISHPFPVTAELEKNWYESHLKSKDSSYIPFTVISKGSGKVAGYFSLNNVNWISRNGFVSGAIGERQDQGQGMGREAVELLLKYAFENLNLHKIYAYVRTDHPALKTWADLGAVTEGILKEHFFCQGIYHDVALLAWFNKSNSES